MSEENKEIVPERHEEVRPFYLERVEDESGVSGTGIVAIGVELPSGKCCLEWRTVHSSVCIYNNITDVANIHGHHGKTRVVWGSPNSSEEPKKKTRRKKSVKVSKKPI